MSIIKQFNEKNSSQPQLDYSFLLISLYFFLIIFFVLLTHNFVINPEYSSIARKSIAKQFSSSNKIIGRFLVKNIYERNFSKFYFNRILEYSSNYPDRIINKNIDEKEIINFALPQDAFFSSENEMKLLLHKFAETLNQQKKIEIKLRILLSYQKPEELENLRKKLNEIMFLLDEVGNKYNLQIGFIHNSTQQIKFNFYY